MYKKMLLERAALAVIAALCFVNFFSCGKAADKITVYMPDGAPAMALAQMMDSGTSIAGKDVEYRVVNPSVIASKVTNEDESKNADVCVLPVTAASKIAQDGARYQMLGVVTSGNLYLISNDAGVIGDFAEYGSDDISHLIGKTVGVMKINEVPGLTFKSVLDGYGVAWQELRNDGAVAADKVNLMAIMDAAAVDPLANVACWVVAEPAASVQVKKKGFTIVANMTELYNGGGNTVVAASAGGAVQVYTGYPQAVMIVKRSILEADREWLDAFLEALKNSANTAAVVALGAEKTVEIVTAHLEDKAYATTLKAEVLTADVVARCGVGFVKNAMAKEAVKGYLQRIVAVNENAASVVGEEFFYF